MTATAQAHDFKGTAAAALAAANAVLSHWLPDGKHQGSEYKALNPTRNDSRLGNFSINTSTGQWADFATDDKGGDIISLIAYLDGCNQGEAESRLADFLGIQTPVKSKHNGNKHSALHTVQAAPIPDSAPPTYIHPTLDRPAQVWAYRTTDGKPWFYVCRFDLPDDKEIRPLSYDGTAWKWKGVPAPRPLYNLHHLADRPAAPVLVTEGEKAADAAAGLFPDMVVTTTSNGAKAPDKADLSPLKGRTVYIWPDNDDQGKQYADKVAALAHKAGAASVAILKLDKLPGELPPKGDAADVTLTADEAAELLADSEAWRDIPKPEERDAGQAEADEWPAIIPLPERGDMGEAEAYRLDLLPEAIQKAAREVSRFSKVPATSPAVIGLSVLAAAIGKKAVIVEREGLEHYPALFFSLIAYSGERKSPPFKKMTYPLEQFAEDQQESHDALTREAKATNEMIDVQASALKNRAKKEGANLEGMTIELAELESRRIQPPPFPSLFTTDTTEQRLFQKLHDRGGAYAVMSGEGRPVLDAIMGKYSGDGRTGDAVYLAGISGDTITRDRVGGDKGPEERVITEPCLNVCIMVQQGKYLEAASHPALRDSGALARIWPVWLPTMAGSRIEQESDTGLNTGSLTAYNCMVRDVLKHQPEKNKAGRTIPHKARLSPEATAARREFHNAIERLMAEGEDLEDVRDIASKAVSQTCKLALVLHIAENHTVLNQADSTISANTWATAQALGTYHLQEAVRVQRLADEDSNLEPARRVLRWVRKENLKEITATILMQQGPRPRPKAAEAGAILEMLSDRYYLNPEKVQGKRKPIYTVNPAYLAALATLAGGDGEK